MGKIRIPRKYRSATQKALIAAAGAGPIGAFVTAADIASIAGIWGALLYSVAKEECYVLDKDVAVNVCKSALLGMGGYYAGCKIATKIFLFIPGAGLFAAMGVSAFANVLFTYRFALTLTTMFQSKGDSLELQELVTNIKNMYTGNGLVDDVLQIADIYKNG